MNPDELIAQQYLKMHYDNVIYEPDGNIPPDFSLNGHIGIEVRRLNQQHFANEKSEGLEEASIRLRDAIKDELSKYPFSENDNNFWLKLKYKRDIGNITKIKKNTVLAVNAFQAQNEKIPFTYPLSENLTLKFFAKAQNHPSFKYNIGSYLDHDGGGRVIDMYVRAVRHCIRKKEPKIQAYKEKYQSWWLLLVDHINFIDSYDKEDIEKELKELSCFEMYSPCFEKIIVIKYDLTLQIEI